MRKSNVLSKTLLSHASKLDTTGFEADYNQHLAAARAIPAERVNVMRLEPELAFGNGEIGGSLVLDHEHELAKSIAAVSPEAIRQLPSYASAVLWANGVIGRYEPTPTQIKRTVSRARELRKLLMSAAVMLSLAGVVSATTVAKIKKGRGDRDAGQDCVDLSILLANVPEEAAAKMAVTTADLAEARAVGEQVVKSVKARRAKRTISKEHAAAIDMRDRMWTLYEQTWERHVWLAGAYLFGRKVDSYIPTLGVRMAKHSEPIPAPPAPVSPTPVTPVPAPTPVSGS